MKMMIMMMTMMTCIVYIFIMSSGYEFHSMTIQGTFKEDSVNVIFPKYYVLCSESQHGTIPIYRKKIKLTHSALSILISIQASLILLTYLHNNVQVPLLENHKSLIVTPDRRGEPCFFHWSSQQLNRNRKTRDATRYISRVA